MHTQYSAFFNRLRIARKVAGHGIVSLSTLLALLLLFAPTPAAFGQTSTATLTGNVTDPHGAVVQGATVTVFSAALAIKRQTTTNGEGNYTVAQLPPSTYSVRVEAFEFAVAEVSNLILQVGQQATQNVSLAVKSGNETLNIESGGQVLTNTQNAEIGEVIENKRIIELPLNGRQFTQLIALTPGIGTPAGGTSRNELTGGFDDAN